MNQKQQTLFTTAELSRVKDTSPTGYKGFYGFHKYWGKKPHEPLAFIIDVLTSSSQVVLDPFVGSGTAGREALLLGRRFIGFDLNPVAIELSTTLLRPPFAKDLNDAFHEILAKTKDKILESYALERGETSASHYLWNGDCLEQVWVRGKGGRRQRVELAPTPHDFRMIESYSEYRSRYVREPRFFTNGRINASPEMCLNDICICLPPSAAN